MVRRVAGRSRQGLVWQSPPASGRIPSTTGWPFRAHLPERRLGFVSRPIANDPEACVAHYMARMLFVVALAVSTLLALVSGPSPGTVPLAASALWAGPAHNRAERTVFLVGEL